MTTQEIEAISLRRLISEIERDLKSITEICQRLSEFYAVLGSEPTAHEQMALAGYIHHFYTGIETVHERIARVLEGGIPHSPQWHRELLEDMALEMEGIRPRVISTITQKELADYLGFRHVFRHAYATELDWERLEPLVQRLEGVFHRYQSELNTFIAWLRSTAEALNEKQNSDQ